MPMIDILGTLDEKIENNLSNKKTLIQYGLRLFEQITSSKGKKCSCGKLFTFVNGYAFKSGDYRSNGNHKVITIKNITDDGFNSSNADTIDYIDIYAKSRLDIGDILLTMTGEVGRVGIVDIDNALLNQRVLKVVSASPFFTYFSLLSHSAAIKSLAKGSVQQNLGIKELSNYSIDYCDIKDYKQYDWIIEKLLIISKENSKLNELKSLYLKKFFG